MFKYDKQIMKKESLGLRNKELSKEWHPIKNGKLTPYDVTCGSGKKVWWQCDKGHEWQAIIGDRVRGNKCPYCSGKRVTLENSLATNNLKLASEWHPDKNGKLTPNDVTPFSNKKVWWKCDKGHEWQASINNRSKNRGCPYCSNKKVCNDNCLATINPKLALEWHPDKNEELTPYDVVPGSHKKVWWKCDKGHEWQSTVLSRNSGSNCPYCCNQSVTYDNCLFTLNPKLAKEWHPSKNGKLTSNDVTPFSNKKVWWKCDKGHEWQSSINNRSKDKGCPYCSNKKVCNDNCLMTLNPELSKEWNYDRNGELTPYDVIAGSNKKVWWRCDKGHEWESSIEKRYREKQGCPYCSNQKACIDNCLATINPELSKEWHPIKNGDLTPYDVMAGSSKKVWWKCSKGHEWQSTIADRNTGKNCPYCSNRYVNDDNCLVTINPELSKEWNYDRNGELTPYDIVAGSGQKVWWKCSKGHEWQANISSRNKGTGCPYCNGYQTSFPEQTIYFYLKKIFKNVHNRYKYNGIELDVFIEDINLGIEYDGAKYHSSEEAIRRDINKNDLLSKMDIKFLRIREDGCPIIDMKGFEYIKYKRYSNYSNIKELIEDILDRIIKINNKYIDECMSLINEVDIDKDRFKILGQYKNSDFRYVNNTRFNQLSKEWNYLRNGNLKLENFKVASKEYVWWKCDKGHEWKAIIGSRYNGTGCPYCSNQKVCIDNCLATISPKLSKEWHPIKNEDLTPYDVIPGSSKKVWWKCDKGHEWQASISSRYTGAGCPYCSNQKACIDNCLATINPELSKEWHPIKNGDLTPYDVVYGSGKKVWWKCNKGHEWQSPIRERSKGRGCPYCTGKKICIDNCLATINPELSKEWHPIKNGDLTPYDVMPGSSKKVWWKCDKGHEWEARISNRSNGSKCHYCTGQKVTIDKSLGNLNKVLSKEWNLIKNKELTPYDVGIGSHKKVWWKCSKGHEWQAKVYSRTAGSGCPECYKESRTGSSSQD